MNIARTAKYILISLCIVVFVGPYMLYKGLYWHGLRYLPEERQPIRDDTLPAHLLDLTWKEFRGTGPRRMVPVRFDHFISMFIAGQKGETWPRLTPSSPVSSSAARILLSQNSSHLKHLEWQIAWTSTAIWLSHNWTIDETLSTILHSAYYGHDMHGISQAAEGYFTKTPDMLDPEESAVLLVITYRPGGLEPWCRPEANLERANKLLLKISGQTTMQALPETLVPPPAEVCSK